MEDTVELESEVRILDISGENVFSIDEGGELVSKIIALGGVKVFDGHLTTRILRQPRNRSYKPIRLRWMQGVKYLVGSHGTNLTKIVDETKAANKKKTLPKENFDSNEQTGTRNREEHTIITYKGNHLEESIADYALAGYREAEWDKRRRVSYESPGGRRFELDLFEETWALGKRALPLMLEIETCDSRLTIQTVRDLGFEFPHPKVVDWPLGRIFDYYARQNPDAE